MMHDPKLGVRSIDELVFHMPTAARLDGTEWARAFAANIVQQARRKRWKPTAKQEALMRRMVSEMFTARRDDGDDELIEVLE